MNAARLALPLAASLATMVAAHAQDLHATHEAHDSHALSPAEHTGMQHELAVRHGCRPQAGVEGRSCADDARAGASTPRPAATDARPASGHIAPPPPQHAMGTMSPTEMVEVMGMDDRASYGLVAFDRFEAAHSGAGTAFGWSARATFGGDEDRFALRSEGERSQGRIGHADLELLWSHAIAPFWDTQVGVRRDVGQGPDRSWAAFGVQGLAPYWFEVGATAYVGEQGRTALRGEVEYDALLTQRLVLQPRLEVNAYGKDDRAAGIGAGLSDAAVGLRLRYEIRREFAPYIGIERRWRFGGTAEAARAGGEAVAETQWVAGVRFWF